MPVVTKETLFGTLSWLAWVIFLSSILLDFRASFMLNLLLIAIVTVIPIFHPLIGFDLIGGSIAFLGGFLGISSLCAFIIHETLASVQKARDELNSITEASSDAIFMMDPTGRIAFSNTASETMFGFVGENVIGKNLHEILAPKRFHKAHNEAHEKFLKTGTGAAIGKSVELAGLRNGSKEFPNELSLNSLRIKNEWWAVGTIRDITVRKELE